MYKIGKDEQKLTIHFTTVAGKTHVLPSLSLDTTVRMIKRSYHEKFSVWGKNDKVSMGNWKGRSDVHRMGFKLLYGTVCLDDESRTLAGLLPA